MPLTLRTMKNTSAGRTRRTTTSSWTAKSLLVASTRSAEERQLWSMNTSPYLAPPPNNALARSLEEAKQQFKERYEEMKAQGVRPFA
jgi:hypothetical protein